MIQKHEPAKEGKVISADNIGSFYKFVNNQLTCSSGIKTLTDNACNAVTSDADKAELLNQLIRTVDIALKLDILHGYVGRDNEPLPLNDGVYLLISKQYQTNNSHIYNPAAVMVCKN